jgi:riboflavin-specific deaminase-like protein
MLSLYLPLCTDAQAAALVIGQMGQSLDGQIATAGGASRSVNGPETIRHLHRLRALCDSVLVGARTVERDDPQLTTRLVPGDNPTRVVVDPSLRLSGEYNVFRDGAAPTLVVCAAGQHDPRRFGSAEIVEVPSDRGVIEPRAILAALRRRGLRRTLVEGGGVTVSRFLQARSLDRLHVILSPVLLGRGRPGISLTSVEALEPLAMHRHALGDDLLFDFGFSGRAE